MFFVLSKTLGALIYPLVLIFLLFLAGFFVRKRSPRLCWWLFWVALGGLYALTAEPTVDVILRPLERPFEQRAEPRTVDAIVVLGGSLDLGRSTAEHPAFGPEASRFVEGVELAQRHPEAVLIFSGGTGSLFDSGKREGTMLKELAVRFGVDERRIRAEDNSRNTRENAVESKRMLDELGAHSVVLVTSAYHMRRSLGCFAKVGAHVTPYAVDFRGGWGHYDPTSFLPHAQRLDGAVKALKEYVGLAAYRVKGYL